MEEQKYKFVNFEDYCKTCMYADTPEDEDPCYDCLAEATNLYSHRPVSWKLDVERRKANNERFEKEAKR